MLRGSLVGVPAQGGALMDTGDPHTGGSGVLHTGNLVLVEAPVTTGDVRGDHVKGTRGSCVLSLHVFCKPTMIPKSKDFYKARDADW